MPEHKTVPFSLTKLDAESGTFEGYAATFGNLDLVGDIIHPSAFTKTLAERGGKVRLLWQHDMADPIGKPLELREDARGLYIKAKLSDCARGRDAHALLRDGAIDSMSIGYDVVAGGTDYSKTADGKTVRNLRELKLYEISLVSFPANELATVLSVKGAVPFKATEMCPEGEAWSAPTLSDFTDKGWADLTDAERKGIAGHYAYVANMPPETFGDCKLPHHRASDGKVVWRGVAAAMARMGQAAIPEGDMGAVRSHLEGHYKQFNKPMPGEPAGMGGKAADFAATFARGQAADQMRDMRWQMDRAFDECMQSLAADSGMGLADKQLAADRSCDQYAQTLKLWCRAMLDMAEGGADMMRMAGGGPAERKRGARFSAASRQAIQAALDTLAALIAESDDEETQAAKAQSYIKQVNVEAFWSHVAKGDGKNAHWLWTGAKNDKGYGILEVDGETVRAHRVAWMMEHGAIPDGKDVGHKTECATTSCVRDSHLELVTNEENAAERATRDKSKHEKSAPGPDGQAVNDSDSAQQAGPDTAPPTETKAAGSDVVPPPSEYETRLAELEAGFQQIEAYL